MKTTITVLAIFFSLKSLIAQDSIEQKIKEVRAKQLQLRKSNDSSDWQKDKMDYDLKTKGRKIIMTDGVFTYPKYSLLNNFKGLGAGGRASASMPIQLKDKQIVYSYLRMNKNELYPAVENDNEIFFAIITVVDVNASNYKAPANVWSRNHPDYLGEGFIRSDDTQIDFIAFTTIDKGNFAIINKRIFDLSHGAIILIAPHKDGTLRSMQLKEGPQIINPDANSFEELKFDNFVRTDLLKRLEVIDFFTNANVK